jgi:hypothetical protein
VNFKSKFINRNKKNMEKCLSNLLAKKNSFTLIFFILLFFPFFIKINIFNYFIINLKDFIFLISAAWLHIFIIKKIENKKKIKLINYLLIIILFIHVLSSFFFMYISKKNYTYFYADIIRSIIICYSCIIFFFIFNKTLREKNLISIIKLFYFINILIFIEFILSIIIKKILNFQIIQIAYPDNIFRSMIVNGHIVTTIFLCTAIILGFYLYELKKEKRYLISNILLIIPVFSNIETRLTIFAFVFSIILLFLFKKKKNFSLKFLIISNILFLLMLLGLVVVSNYENGHYFVNIFEYKIYTSSLIDRVNLLIISIISFFNYPYGFGYQTSSHFFPYLKFMPNIFIGSENLFGSFLIFTNNYIETHGSPARNHSYIANILNTFGIFLFPIYAIFKKIFKKKEYFTNNLKFYISIILVFFSTSSILNYTYETELLFTFFLSFYWRFYKKI